MPRRARSATPTTNASKSDWMPSNTAQSARRRPAKTEPRTKPNACANRLGSSVPVAKRANRSTSVVTSSPNRRRPPRGRCALPSAVVPSARRASDAVEWTVDRVTGRSGQIACAHSACRTPPRWKARYTTSSSAALRRNEVAMPRTTTGPRTATSTSSSVTPLNGRQDRKSGGGGIRTLTGDGLSALPLPVGLHPRATILDRVGHPQEDDPMVDDPAAGRSHGSGHLLGRLPARGLPAPPGQRACVVARAHRPHPRRRGVLVGGRL